MPFGLLIGLLIAACGVGCALTRWFRYGVARIAAIVVNELPFAFGYLLIASVVLAVVQGDLDSPGGAVVAGLAGLDLVGLGVIVRRALLAHSAFENSALGPVGPPHRPWGRILLAPLPVIRRDPVVRGLSYGDGPRRTVDVHHRRDRPSGVPVVLHLHGGGFHSGNSRREARPLIRHLVRHGVLCVSANYRLQPHVTYADQLADVRAAIGWLQSHAGEYGGDPGRLVLVGSSAGAYLSIDAVNHGVTGVVGLVCRYGYYGDLTPGDLPPILVIHGENDLQVSLSNPRAFVERAQATSHNPVIYVELPGAHHDFDLYESIRSAAVTVAVESFITRVTGDGILRADAAASQR